MDAAQEQALIENVKSLTDKMTMVDKVFEKLRVGQNMVLAFQCGHSQLYFPGDYLKQWGRLYGIGLGPTPVSEVLDTDYYTAPPTITNEIKSLDQIMHPVGNCFAQVDAMLVEESAYNAAQAILAIDDPYMDKRIAIIRPKQLENPLSKMGILAAMWAQKGRR